MHRPGKLTHLQNKLKLFPHLQLLYLQTDSSFYNICNRCNKCNTQSQWPCKHYEYAYGYACCSS